MESKDILMQVKEAIIRLEKLHKSIRVTVIGVARPTIWSILINEECIVELNNISMPGRLQMTTKLDGHRIRSLVKNKQTVNKKKPSHHGDRLRTLWRRCAYHCQSLQLRDTFMNVNIEGLLWNANQ